MALEVNYNSKTGNFSLKASKHVLNLIGASLVISGFATLSSPWWFGLVLGFLEKSNININDDYQWIISLFQIIVGVVLLVFRAFIDGRLKKIEQDSVTWAEAAIDIDCIEHFLNQIVDDHSYTSSQVSEYHKFYSHFLKPQHSFQYTKTKNIYQNFSDNALTLHEFMSVNFWCFPRNQTWTTDYRYCLAPHLNEDRDGDPTIENSKQYSALSKELNQLHNQVISNFRNFIGHLKKVKCI